ncbi:SDR family NAD(P)-dependent oxidoreductase [Pseudonocardia thermophila]|uniref:SDR family NAD(P)-dependent oxidoreductase n=1 Tax=Pseudonocardia thermophila TaxID=1848 RepID=UPI00248E11D2|nr:SDR family oxidoreductase [Pseudonocardia thermophila]
MDLGLTGKKALVTGASSGIGRAVAIALAREGVQTVISGRRTALLESLAEEIKAVGPVPHIVTGDLSDVEDVDHIAAQALEHLGRVDVLVNNAGVSLPIARGDDDAWTYALASQFTAVRRMTEKVLPAMLEAGWGRIVNSGGTLEPPDQVNGSTVAKAAVLAWAKSLSREVGRSGVTVNTIIPGRIATEQILTRLHADPAERARFAEENIPLGYFGEPEDAADLIVFLASERARYITGEVIHIDGGLRRFGF